MSHIPRPPASEQELLERALGLRGRTLQQLANSLGMRLPRTLRGNKGLIGQMLETWLGADASSAAEPDFTHLGVELKSLPVTPHGRPAESTFVSAAPLNMGRPLVWESSGVYRKLRRVLWIPVESGGGVPLPELHIGAPVLWSPRPEVERQLRADWEELGELICLGRLHELSAELGTWLQIRPKAANARALAAFTDAQGECAQTLPRAFYLRARFAECWVLNKT